MQPSRCVAVIIARHRSDPIDLSGRSELRFGEESVLGIIRRRLARSRRIEKTVLATTRDPSDDPVAAEGARVGLEVLRFEAESVLERLKEAFDRVDADLIVKVNGNYPLVCPESADALVDFHREGGFEFSYNEHHAGVPLGLGVTVFSRGLFQRLDVSALTAADLIRGDFYLMERLKAFKVGRQNIADPRPQYKLCLWTGADQVVIAEVLKANRDPSLKDIVAFLDQDPVLAQSNLGVVSRPEIGMEKLLLFPEKAGAILAGRDLDETYPVSVELSLTNRCNAACVWCSDLELRGRQAGKEMDQATLSALLDDLKAGGTRGVVFEGGGEPTLHPAFPDLVRYAVAVGLKAGLITNGIDLRGVDPAAFEWIRVSLDAPSREAYKRLKKVDRFDAVMANIRAMAQAGAVVGVGYLVSNANMDYAALEELILDVRSSGARYIHFRPIIDHPDLAATVDPTVVFCKFNTPTFSVLNSAMQENAHDGNHGLPCVAHSLTTVVTANGDVYLCGRLNIHPWFEPFGNLTQARFRDLWTGEKRREQAKQVLAPEWCLANCPRCRLTKFNVLFQQLSTIQSKNFI